MVEWKLYYHIIWTTQEQMPLIKPHFAHTLYTYLTEQSEGLGADLLAVNGMNDHIHLVVSIPPTVSPQDFIHTLKGKSFQFVVDHYGDYVAWQPGFGIVTLDRSDLAEVIQYVEDQKKHHDQGTLIAMLERST